MSEIPKNGRANAVSSIDGRKLVRSAKWTAIAKLGGQLTTFAATLVLARLLEKDDFGLFAMAVLCIWLMEQVSDFGFQSAIIQRSNVSDTELSSCFWLLLAVAVVVATLAVFGAPVIASVFAEPRISSVVRSIAGVFLLLPITVVTTAMLSKSLQIDDIAKIELMSGFLRCAVAIGTAYFLRLGLHSLLIGFVVERTCLASALWLRLGWRPRWHCNLAEARPLMNFGAQVTASRVLWALYSRLDTVVIGRLLGADTLGIYNLGTQLAQSVSQFASSVYYRIAFPVLSLRKDSNDFAGLLLRSSVYLSIMVLPFFFGLSAVAQDVVDVLLGEKWRGAVPVVQVIALASAAVTVSGLLPQAMSAKGRADIGIMLNLVSVAAFGAGFWIGASAVGLVGVLLAWIILVPLRTGWMIVVAAGPCGYGALEYVRRHTAVVAAAGCMYFSVRVTAYVLADWEPLWRLFVCCACGASVYTAAIAVFDRPTTLTLVRTMLKGFRT
jgi:O-antigen/teichoic acid export membrane protein